MEPVQVSGDSFDGRVVEGRIAAIAAMPGQAAGDAAPRYEIKVALPPLPAAVRGNIRLGMSASIQIVTYATPAAMVVPVSAVVADNGRQFVRLAGKRELREVQVKHSTAAGLEVVGLAPGSVIYTR